MVCSRPLQIKNRHAEFISASHCLHSFSVFPIGNTPFVHIVYSSTTHVNGYSFRLDISYGNISFVLRTHRVCKENHSCSRLLQIVVQDRYKQLYETVEAIVFRPWKLLSSDRGSYCLQTVEASPKRRDSETSLPVGR